MIEDSDFTKKITNAVISYLIFLKTFNTIKQNYTFIPEYNLDETINKSYIIRPFSLNCYIIDKEFLDIFKSAINFNELKKILDPINEENKNKFKEKLKIYLNEHPYKFSTDNVKFFSTRDEIKELLENNIEYEIVNEKFCIGIGIPLDKLDKKKFLCSKNKDNICFFSPSNQFLMTVNQGKKIIYNTNKDKNIYYVDGLTSKILTLLYAQNKYINQKIKKHINNIYGFKKYYLINKEWIQNYKEFFQFEIIKNKLEALNYPYKGYKLNLKNIVKYNIGQILLGDSKIPNNLEIKNLLLNFNKIYSTNNVSKSELSLIQETIEPEENNNNNNSCFEYPIEFEIINEDIYQLLLQQNFFNKDIDEIINDKIIGYQTLFGEDIIIIKNVNQNLEKEEINVKKLNEYLVYSKIKNEYELQCIINYYKENTFLEDIEKYIKGKGLTEYINKKCLDINAKQVEQDIKDEKKNIIGKFLNVSIKDLKKFDTKYLRRNSGLQLEFGSKININYLPNKLNKQVNNNEFKENKNKYMNYQIDSSLNFEFIKMKNLFNAAINKDNINDVNISKPIKIKKNLFITSEGIENGYCLIHHTQSMIEKQSY